MYTDKSFDFVVKTAPAPVLLMEAANLKSGSKEPNRNKVGSVTWDQVRTIAETKMVDLNAFKIEAAMKSVAGTARSMGIIALDGNTHAGGWHSPQHGYYRQGRFSLCRIIKRRNDLWQNSPKSARMPLPSTT